MCKDQIRYRNQTIYQRTIILQNPGGLFLSPRSWAFLHIFAAAAKSLQLCSTLCDPIDGSPWGSPVPGILQARTLEWLARYLAVCNSLQPRGLQPIRFLCPWGFSRQEYWSGLPCPPPGDLPNFGIEPRSPALQADSLPSEPPGKPLY